MRVEGAIPLGPGGTGVITFNTLPPPSEWATWSISGGSADIQSPAALDAEVQVLSAADVTNTLAVTRTVPPATAQRARWNEILQLLQTKLDGTRYIAFMATLQNLSGTDLTQLQVRCEVTSDRLITEEVPGYRVYFSQSGAVGSWQVVPDLSTGITGLLSATIDLGFWPSNGTLYLLWADDNSFGNDAYYTMDNFAAWPARATTAVIPIPPGGTGTNHFSNLASATNWTTRPSSVNAPGTASSITNSQQLDAAVQLFSAHQASSPLGTTSTTPPDPGQRADWHFIWEAIVSSPSANDFTPILATLRNDTGAEQFALRVSYLGTDGVTNGVEDVPRFRAYYSLTGLPGHWYVIPEFCNATGRLSARLELGRWPPGAPLFLLWADDNSPYGRDIGNAGSPREGVNRIDDFSARPIAEPRLQVLSHDAAITLAWPVTAEAFVPFSTTNLLAIEWSPIAINLLPSNDLRRTQVTRTNSAQYFRLQKN